jgi:multidrug resistance efflux pump
MLVRLLGTPDSVADIKRFSIYSPFAGVLSKVNLEVGQFVGVHESCSAFQKLIQVL